MIRVFVMYATGVGTSPGAARFAAAPSFTQVIPQMQISEIIG